MRLKEVHDFLKPGGMIGQKQLFWWVHCRPICRRSILEVFFRYSRRYEAMAKTGKEMLNSSREPVNTNSGSSVGSGAMLSATVMGVLLSIA